MYSHAALLTGAWGWHEQYIFEELSGLFFHEYGLDFNYVM